MIQNKQGYTLVEIVITIALTAVVVAVFAYAMLNFRNNVQYDILLNRVVESVNYAKTKSMSAKLDSQALRSSYSVKFFENKIVEFEGDIYVEGADTNIEYEVPFGLELSSSCTPVDDGVVSFSAVKGENENSCTVGIHKFEAVSPTGTVYIGRYGVQQAY